MTSDPTVCYKNFLFYHLNHYATTLLALTSDIIGLAITDLNKTIKLLQAIFEIFLHFQIIEYLQDFDKINAEYNKKVKNYVMSTIFTDQILMPCEAAIQYEKILNGEVDTDDEYLLEMSECYIDNETHFVEVHIDTKNTKVTPAQTDTELYNMLKTILIL